MNNTTKTPQEIEQEMLEMSEQFSTFLHTKGIKAKFKLPLQPRIQQHLLRAVFLLTPSYC